MRTRTDLIDENRLIVQFVRVWWKGARGNTRRKRIQIDKVKIKEKKC